VGQIWKQGTQPTWRKTYTKDTNVTFRNNTHIGKIVLPSMGDQNIDMHHHECLLLTFEEAKGTWTMVQWEDKRSSHDRDDLVHLHGVKRRSIFFRFSYWHVTFMIIFIVHVLIVVIQLLVNLCLFYPWSIFMLYIPLFLDQGFVHSQPHC